MVIALENGEVTCEVCDNDRIAAAEETLEEVDGLPRCKRCDVEIESGERIWSIPPKPALAALPMARVGLPGSRLSCSLIVYRMKSR